MTEKLTAEGFEPGVKIHGPFRPEYKITLDGFIVPWLTAQPTEDGKYFLTVDGRLGMADSVSVEEMSNWMPLLANAMAVAAGYPCFGEDRAAPLITPTRKTNPFNQLMFSLSGADEGPKLAIVRNEE